MLKSISITNFRCLRDVKVDFAPLTAFVGPNASGKSSLLAALDPSMNPSHRDIWRRRAGIDVRLEVITEAEPFSRVLSPQEGLQVRGWSGSFQLVKLALNVLRQANVVSHAPQLAPDGSNLTNVFGTLTRKQQSELAKELCRLVPMFADVDVEPTQSGYHRLRFQDAWNPNLWYAPEEVSDGTMLLLALLTLQYQNPPVDMLAIEEPEQGVHPYLVKEVVGLLRRMAHGKLGPKRVQVVLATHSPQLLDYLEPEEVRFLSRSSEDGSVVVEKAPTDSAQWKESFREYRESLSSAWLSGGLGGVP